MLKKRTNPLIRFGAWDVVDAGDAKAKRTPLMTTTTTTTRRKRKDGTTTLTTKETTKKKNNNVVDDALTRFVVDFREVHTFAPDVLPECERRTEVLERLETTRAKAEKTPSVVVQRFKIDMTAKTGVVDNDDDAIEEDVEKAVKMAVGLSTREDENEDEDEASCEVRVLETSEGAVASSSSPKDMDELLLSWTFEKVGNPFRAYRLKTTTRMTTKTRRTPQRRRREYECYRDEERRRGFRRQHRKTDLETSLKSLHPFAISIRRLSNDSVKTTCL